MGLKMCDKTNEQAYSSIRIVVKKGLKNGKTKQEGLRLEATWSEIRFADPASTKVPLDPTSGRSRSPESATIRPSALLLDQNILKNANENGAHLGY